MQKKIEPQTEARETVIRYSQTLPSTWQIIQIALELSKKPDGSIDRKVFEENCSFALQKVVDLQHDLKSLLEDSPIHSLTKE